MKDKRLCDDDNSSTPQTLVIFVFLAKIKNVRIKELFILCFLLITVLSCRKDDDKDDVAKISGIWKPYTFQYFNKTDNTPIIEPIQYEECRQKSTIELKDDLDVLEKKYVAYTYMNGCNLIEELHYKYHYDGVGKLTYTYSDGMVQDYKVVSLEANKMVIRVEFQQEETYTLVTYIK